MKLVLEFESPKLLLKKTSLVCILHYAEMQASWIKSQKGTNFLADEQGYRINRLNATKTLRSYRCVKRDLLKCNAIAYYIVDSNQPQIEKISGEHCHGADILHDYVRNKENILVKAAAAVGNAVTAFSLPSS